MVCVPQRETAPRPLCRRFSKKQTLQHTPSSSLDPGTILQPTMTKAINVSSAKKKDLSKCSRYMLTHQEVVPGGEIKTKLIKVCSPFFFLKPIYISCKIK